MCACVRACACTALARTRSVDQSGLELGDPPTCASQVLGLKLCTTIEQVSLCPFLFFLNITSRKVNKTNNLQHNKIKRSMIEEISSSL